MLAIARSRQASEQVPEAEKFSVSPAPASKSDLHQAPKPALGDQESIRRDAQRAVMVEAVTAALSKVTDPDVLCELLVIALDAGDEKIKELKSKLADASKTIESLNGELAERDVPEAGKGSVSAALELKSVLHPASNPTPQVLEGISQGAQREGWCLGAILFRM
jgi:hypothetical protein